MSICTTTDVYSAASLIGQELQLLIDEHGPGDFENLMQKVIQILEELEFCVSHSNDTLNLIGELQEQIDALKSERGENDFALDMDLMQQSWYNETQKLMDEVAELEAENERLKYQLENAEAEAESEATTSRGGDAAYRRVSELVTGRGEKSLPRPPSLPIQPIEVDSLLAHTEERLLLVQQDNRAADLQLIRLLKAGLINQAREIKETRREILFTEAAIDAAEEEVCRLARESGQQLATRSAKQANHWSSEQVTLEANLAACERKISELSLQMANASQVDSIKASSMPLHVAPGEGLESAVVGVGDLKEENEEKDNLLALEQLRSLLYERNSLRCQLVELKAGLAAVSGIENDGDVVYGPLPKEPMEKLYSDYIKPKSAVKSLFVELLQRITEKSS